MITKEEAIEDLQLALSTGNYIFTKSRESLRMAIKALSVPEREKGEWFAITQPWADTQLFQCTCCGRHIEVSQYEVSTLIIRYPFCHCGADMRGDKGV